MKTYETLCTSSRRFIWWNVIYSTNISVDLVDATAKGQILNAPLVPSYICIVTTSHSWADPCDTTFTCNKIESLFHFFTLDEKQTVPICIMQITIIMAFGGSIRSTPRYIVKIDEHKTIRNSNCRHYFVYYCILQTQMLLRLSDGTDFNKYIFIYISFNSIDTRRLLRTVEFM